MTFLTGCQVFGQNTTGSLEGLVTDSLGIGIPFATIIAINTETNHQNGTFSQEGGKFTFLNLPPSEYIIKVTNIGYGDYHSQPLYVSLGGKVTHDLTLFQTSNTLDEVVIFSDSQEKTNQHTISYGQVTQTPTLFRSIQELNRANPENNLNSFQGASHRFNNLNIDGVGTNDIIGFQEPASGAAGSQANGTPGSLSKSQPIGFGAIKELSVQTTPFDVSVGNFNGANIDVVTKNGTNQFRHGIFGYGNNQWTIGKRLDNSSIETGSFSDYQIGLNSGGPIIKNKLFYFINIEYANAQTPLLNRPGTANSSISIDDVQLVRNKLIEEFNYDPGAFNEASNQIQSTKVFSRLDYVVNDHHTITLRHNNVNGFADNLEWSNNFFNFGNQGYRHQSNSNSAVLELKSNFRNVFNKFNISYNRVKEGRTFNDRVFPHIQIATSASSRIFAGTYREASVFNTDFNTFQLTNKIYFIKENHTISGGILFQLHDVNYGFLSAWNGRWEYSSLDNFLNDLPSRVRGVYHSNPLNNSFEFVQNNPSASFGISESAIYIQDQWDIAKHVQLSGGIRVDAQFLTSTLPISPLIVSSTEFNEFSNELTNNYQFNPRLSFDYDIGNSGLSLSIGTGLFSGRLPYLWFAYMDYVSGTDYLNIDIRPSDALPLTERLDELAHLQPGISEINLLDPDFKYPRDWKSNLNLNWMTRSKWEIGFSFTYTNVLQGLLFQTLNRNENLNQLSGADNRPFYNTSGAEVRVNPNFTNVFVLTNTSRGFRYNATLKAERKSKNSYTYFGYSYGLSKDVSSTVRSSPAANYEWNQAIFGNRPNLSFSNYDLRHNLSLSHSSTIQIGKNNLHWSVLYNGRSGTPFSFIYQGDLNQDDSSRNDLIFVPETENDILLVSTETADGTTISPQDQWSALNTYISSIDYLNEHRGSIVERNGARTPWNHSIDLSLRFEISANQKHKTRLRADIFNTLNLLNPSWGKQYFVPNVVNSSFSLLKFEGIAEDHTPQFSFDIPLSERPWIVDRLTSRWRIQLGIELEF